MEILCISLQFIREQMEISVISCQIRLFFTLSLQFIREQMEIWSKTLAVETKMEFHLFANVLYIYSGEPPAPINIESKDRPVPSVQDLHLIECLVYF